MNSHSVSIYSNYRPSSLVAELPFLWAFNLVLVASAFISIDLPFSPVPITGQTFGVLLVAMALGRTRGVAVVTAYLLEGACGLPVFAGGSAGVAKFMGPTGGYLLGFVGAAWLVGRLADRGWDRGYARSVMAMTLGTGVIFIAGLAWLSRFVDGDALIGLGLAPFIPGAMIKIALASVILPSVWKRIYRRL